MNKFVVCMVWTLAVYTVGCMLLGVIAGGIAGYQEPANAKQAGAEAGVGSSAGIVPLFSWPQ